MSTFRDSEQKYNFCLMLLMDGVKDSEFLLEECSRPEQSVNKIT